MHKTNGMKEEGRGVRWGCEVLYVRAVLFPLTFENVGKNRLHMKVVLCLLPKIGYLCGG